MYCIRLIKNKPVEFNEKMVFDDYLVATHVKISDNKIYWLDPVSNTEGDGFLIDNYTHIFINHYSIYTIAELKEAYSQIVSAYSTLSLSSSRINKYDSVVSVFELLETLFAIKEQKILASIQNTNSLKEPKKTKITTKLTNEKNEIIESEEEVNNASNS